jgi:hypothetical protein
MGGSAPGGSAQAQTAAAQSDAAQGGDGDLVRLFLFVWTAPDGGMQWRTIGQLCQRLRISRSRMPTSIKVTRASTPTLISNNRLVSTDNRKVRFRRRSGNLGADRYLR